MQDQAAPSITTSLEGPSLAPAPLEGPSLTPAPAPSTDDDDELGDASVIVIRPPRRGD